MRTVEKAASALAAQHCIGRPWWDHQTPCSQCRASAGVLAEAGLLRDDEPRMEDTHEEWTIRVYDDQPVPEGKQFAPNNRVVVLHDDKQVREFLYPGYRIWTLLAHWTEGLADIDLSSIEHAEASS